MPGVTDALELLQVTHGYTPTRGTGAAVLLRDMDYTITRGEVHALLGPSGSGKTTLLHLLGGLQLPNEGKVLWNGVDITTTTDAWRTQQRLGVVSFVFQDAHLLPELNVLQNVELPTHLQGRRDPSGAHAMLNLVGLGDRASGKVQALSGGEKQRVAIARALHARPAFVLADEPTARLDASTAEGVMTAFLDAVKQTDVGVLFATHDPARKADADRVWTLNEGTLKSVRDRS
jgi:lipoprotein-releasing system ATP-binding protein